MEARRNAGVAQVASIVYNMFAKQKRGVEDFLPAFARPAGGREEGVPSRFKRDVALLAERGWLRQELLDAVLAVSLEG